jgi:hypothetical protein
VNDQIIVNTRFLAAPVKELVWGTQSQTNLESLWFCLWQLRQSFQGLSSKPPPRFFLLQSKFNPLRFRRVGDHNACESGGITTSKSRFLY